MSIYNINASPYKCLSTRDQRTVRQTHTHSIQTEIPHIHTATVLVHSLCAFPTTGHSCRKLLWDTLVGHSCGTLL